MTTIAVIVCGHTLDRWDDINRSLASVRSQTRAADQIVLSVDNNLELYRAAVDAFTDITVVHNTGHRGVSGARNAAANATNCDVLAYLDDDAVAEDHWIQQLISWYDDPAVLGVGGHAEPAWDGAGPSWFPPSFNWVVGCSHSGIAAAPGPVRNFIGCNMSIRRSAWEAVGGFDESIGRVGADGGGGDETDFCIRVTSALDGLIMNDPAAIVHHRVPPSRQTWSYFISRCRSEGRSKAQIAAQAGTDRALEAERSHLLHELPTSFLRGLGDGLRGDLAGFGRSAAIVVGTAATAFGYFTRRLARRWSNLAPSQSSEGADDFQPRQIVSIDLDEPALSGVDGARPTIVVVRRGARLLAVEQFDSLPPAAALTSHLLAEHPAVVSIAPMSPTPRTAAVVIATRDRTDSLERTLRSLGALHRPPDQIVVVDNAPASNDTRSMIADWPHDGLPRIDYVRCDQPGLAKAHNAALPHITTDIVAFTDDDVIVDPHWLDQLLAGFDQGDDIACVTGAILPAEIETWPQAWVEATSNFSKGFTAQRFSSAAPPDDPLFPYTAGSMGSGANMAFTTRWLTSHPFNDAMGAGTTALGGDDLRSFFDVINSGHALLFTPDAIVFHHHHRTPEAIDRQAYGYGAGLTAFVTSVVLDEPRAVLAIARRVPGALRHARNVTSPAIGPSFPGDRHRSNRQRMGMLAGPVRYLRSRS